LAYKPADNKPGTFVFFYPTGLAGTYSPERTGLQHLAFMVRRRSVVDHIHDQIIAAGGSVIHAPQHFPQYPGHYYATFWFDPFGIKLEAVCHYDRD
jgi:catechol 2,3-dioxygenase-like lactoylglutathione lyase family enzyme